MTRLTDNELAAIDLSPVEPDMARRMVEAILLFAAVGVSDGDAEALAWMQSRHARHYAELIDLDPGRLSRLAAELYGTKRIDMSKHHHVPGPGKGPAKAEALYARWKASGMTVAAFERQVGYARNGLRRVFSYHGWPTR